MNQFLLPRPWWVDLIILVPILTFYFLWKRRPLLRTVDLLVSALFAIGFAYVEAAVVIYLRAVTGYLLGSQTAEIANLSSNVYQVAQLVNNFPSGLLKIELVREGATIMMLCSAAVLTARDLTARWAIFLWMFATWDLFYYLTLRLTVGWPSSLTTSDILFLIPMPWISQVWFPLLVSTITLIVIVFIKSKPRPPQDS
jgi:hypothetical protein